jgi:hypothetical protein
MPGAIERSRVDVKATQDEHTNIATVYVTNSSAEEVVAYYQSLADAGGWQLATTIALAPGQSRLWRKNGYEMGVLTEFSDTQRRAFQGEFRTMFRVSFFVTVKHPDPLQ